MNKPTLLAHLLARWNGEDMYVPDSVERAGTTVEHVGTVATRRVIGPRSAPNGGDQSGEGVVNACMVGTDVNVVGTLVATG